MELAKKEGITMTQRLAFHEVKERNIQTLQQYIPIVAKVHGGAHPEFHEVRKVFDTIQKKISEAGTKKPDLTAEFQTLQKLTGHYAVPKDVCESFETVYLLLAELDSAYQA